MSNKVFKLQITFDDEGGYKGHHGDLTTESLIIDMIKTEMQFRLANNDVIKKDFKVDQISDCIEQTNQIFSKENYEFEAKCRRCNNHTIFHFSTRDHKEYADFVDGITRYFSNQRKFYCDNCNFPTVHDILSYSEPDE